MVFHCETPTYQNIFLWNNIFSSFNEKYNSKYLYVFFSKVIFLLNKIEEFSNMDPPLIHIFFGVRVQILIDSGIFLRGVAGRFESNVLRVSIFENFQNRITTEWLFCIFFFFFFFFNEIECKNGRTRMMQPLWISKDPCITEKKGKLIKWEGGGVGVCEPGFWRFEDCKCSERRRQGGSSSFLKS